MRISVVTYGSEGDTRPFVALCRGLVDRAHEVRLFAEQSSVHIARAHGIEVEPLAGDIKATLPLDDPSRELSPAELVRMVRKGLRGVNANIPSWMSAISLHARSADAVLYAGLASPVAQALAQELHKPAIGLWLQPTTPTREFCSSALPPWRLPGWLNKLSYRASPEALIRRLYGKSSQAARVKMFGAGSNAAQRDFPVLYGFSKHLVERPPDWPASHRICGHWALAAKDWQAPRDLLEFLAGGPAPIYVGFGAASSFIRHKSLTEIVAAIGGRRTLFYPGWSAITASMLPKNFFVIADTPHSWLFPLTSMVIHHGGAGTAHTASRAGVPSVVLPFGGDQLFWAARLASAGVAPSQRVRPGKLNGRILSQMIGWAEQDAVRDRARKLGAAMATEDGVATAVAEIETLLAPAGRPLRRDDIEHASPLAEAARSTRTAS